MAISSKPKPAQSQPAAKRAAPVSNEQPPEGRVLEPPPYAAEYAGKTLQEMAREMMRLKAIKATLDEQHAEVYKRLEWISVNKIPAMMEDAGIDVIAFDNIGKLSLKGDMWASIPAPMRDAAYKWLVENRHGDLISRVVNAQTLKAFVKDCLGRGEALPADMFKVTPYTKAVLK